MRRRPPSHAPAELVTFDLDAWAVPVDRPDPSGFYRYAAALDQWQAARAEFEESTGWEGDVGWWQAEQDAISGMPDQPWDPELI